MSRVEFEPTTIGSKSHSTNKSYGSVIGTYATVAYSTGLKKTTYYKYLGETVAQQWDEIG